MTRQNRNIADIESALDNNRQQMGGTLDALHHRLSVDNMVERTRHSLHDSGASAFFGNFERSVRRNPLPVAAVGIGLAWLIVASSDRAREQIDRHTPDPETDLPDVGGMVSRAGGRGRANARHMRHRIAETAHSGRRTADDLGEQARSGVSRAGGSAQRKAERLYDRADNLWREQPMLTASLGLALGAVVAAGLPRSRPEDRTFGPTRDEVMSSTQAAGEDTAGRAQSVAEAAAHAARDAARSEADRQNLRTEDER